MTPSFRLLASVAALTLGIWSLTACGGSIDNTAPDSGTGGSTGGGKVCTYNGVPYADGATFEASDGCNTCHCEDGVAACTDIGCVGGCTVGDAHYEVGETFPSDACNTCTCGTDGSVSCTLVECATCNDTQSNYSAAFNEAKRCDPGQPNQCTKEITAGLACGCSTFVNAGNSDAISSAQLYQAQWSSMSCGADIVCGPCAEPTGAHCSDAGVCVDDYQDPSELVACKVDGVVYPSGSTGVPDPASCNTCDCDNGKLINCTEINCPTPCPPSAVLDTQCAQCGPTDACQIVETTCLQMCAEGCHNGGVCINGVCKNVCG